MHSRKHQWALRALRAVDGITDKECLSAARALPASLYQLGVLNAWLRYQKNKPHQIILKKELGEFIRSCLPELGDKPLEVTIPELGVDEYYYLLEECLGFASQLKLYAELIITDQANGKDVSTRNPVVGSGSTDH